ncbi:MAG: T9SS type A sorting domain-containing protein, partial [Ignavibacteriaceae bacterium]|nr:T9SS type A sorting domain-containing protein [Ignavibacteriaceae bacterium]
VGSVGMKNIQGLAFEETGVTSVEDDENGTIPTDFSLKQNYPNPFNPTTIISFSIPQSSNVIIKVFDLLGNEIAKLVNEEKLAGSYEVEFNVSGLPSGVYFYQLEAGSFIETKKMILLK